MSDDPELDPELQDELERYSTDMPVVEAGRDADDSNKAVSLAEQFGPEGEWAGKTIIQPQQAHALAVMTNLEEIYPELEGTASGIETMTDDYMQLLTSIEGRSRDQITVVLQSMFGAAGESLRDTSSTLRQIFAMQREDEDE